MSNFYLDSSALAKRYLTEIGSAWINGITDPAMGNNIVIAEITLVEVAAALAARHRGGGLTLAERDAAILLFTHHYANEYMVIHIERAMIKQAADRTQNHRLRGYDAVQLAVALAVNDHYVARGLDPLIFITADTDLAAAGAAEGLAVDNPNHHL